MTPRGALLGIRTNGWAALMGVALGPAILVVGQTRRSHGLLVPATDGSTMTEHERPS